MPACPRRATAMPRKTCKEYGRWNACLTCAHRDCVVGVHNALKGLFPKGFKPHVRPARRPAYKINKRYTDRKVENTRQYLAESIKATEAQRAEDMRLVEDIFGIGGR